MEILLDRKYKKEEYTIGVLYVDGKYFCSTCEDKDRGIDQSMTLSQIKKIKVYGRTAIPTGTYKVKSYWWAKYRKYYPQILDVKGFTGILVHGGKSAQNSLGCVLLGENKIKGGLINSEPYVRKLTSMIQDCEKRGEKVTITIK